MFMLVRVSSFIFVFFCLDVLVLSVLGVSGQARDHTGTDMGGGGEIGGEEDAVKAIVVLDPCA